MRGPAGVLDDRFASEPHAGLRGGRSRRHQRSRPWRSQGAWRRFGAVVRARSTRHRLRLNTDQVFLREEMVE